jgi:hypothetical protein
MTSNTIIKTETVTTHDLVEGDLVRTYGVTFRLRDRKNYGLTAGFDPITQGDCISFQTDVVADDSDGAFPASWQKDYTVQGNRMMTWSRIVKEA